MLVHAKQLLKKLSAIWARAHKIIRPPPPAKLEEYQLKGRQIIAVSGGTKLLNFPKRRYVLGRPRVTCVSIIQGEHKNTP